MFKSHGHLRKLYLKYRTLYFDNELPEDVKVGWSADVSTKDHAHTEIRTYDDGKQEFTIAMNPVIREWPGLYRLVLLHEMCHIKLAPYTKHGKKFNQEMLRLACLGALNASW